jgi:hypothetical protein
MTTLMLSNAPVRNNIPSDSQKLREKPKTIVAAPKAFQQQGSGQVGGGGRSASDGQHQPPAQQRQHPSENPKSIVGFRPSAISHSARMIEPGS